MNQEKLHIIFQKLFHQFSQDEQLLTEYWQELLGFHQEKHRFYHNLTHLENMFAVWAANEHAFELNKPSILKWAIFYHDVIYDVSRNPKNEERSADLAVERLQRLNISNEDQMLCYQLIVSTQKHQPLVKGMENKLLIDLDLEILSKSSEAYLLYTQQIRKEYQRYPDFLYKRGRKKAMKQFLERPRIYYTDHFYEKLEEKARRNLRNEEG